MCLSAALFSLASTASSLLNVRQGVMAAKEARYQAGAAKRAEASAAQSANSRLAARRRALRQNSLLTDEGMPGGGRATLGGE